MKINGNIDLNKTKRVLHYTGTLNLGGAETMIMNVLRAIDKNIIQFDFVVSGSEIGYYEKEAKTLGANIFHIVKRSDSLGKHLVEFYRVIKRNKYRIVHFHTQNAFLSSFEIFVAKLAGVNKIIVHSHNTTDWRTGMPLRLHSVFRPVMNLLTDVRLACGEDAGKWLFGKKKDFLVIPLPVNCGLYEYSRERYDSLRKKYGVEGKIVFSHIGRFFDQKNHDYLIDIFYEIIKKKPESVLFLMGDGELRKSIEEKVKNFGISDHVVFCGNVDDVNEKLIMSDAFLLPSKYEGFPTVVLEAQAAGLPCFISDTITDKIAITMLVNQISISASPQKWVDTILNNKVVVDRNVANKLVAEKYDIQVVKEIFERLYLQ